ncbi:protein-L-isoaspartate(D-aspartate) O-methyltransferase [Inquilinus ginsengisoli]|uniref:Protein-L-isoaspartate O-methyltransferase n=1 Tax=Inquilinus ginsengisoli TaxID=363840 RepID=A0ABU1JJQ4_9PROT|nr:protein-L-isoaspartate(D-aspartate) O-methyltransferase [Inquilinus ginsengisoli]MDR6288842.1 protein-L-isoaspartate(D-aspartate) O-methyltransferase [Inquilinus ginsengisoli]
MIAEPRLIRLLMTLRRSGISDHRVLGAIERVPREAFVPDAFLDQAYEDIALPIGHGQTISQPMVVGLMTQALAVTDRHKVLEIGTGSGYQAAVLARICRRLYTIERHKPLLDLALGRIASMRISNITARWGDGMKGWPEQAPFERIIVTAAHRGDLPPHALTDQLAIGGIIVIPMGDEKRNQRLVRFTRTETGLEREDLWPVRFVPLLPDLPDGEDGGSGQSY